MGRVVTYLVLAALAGTLAWAQNIDGTITGIVEDPSGARIAGVTVTAVNQDTGVHYATATSFMPKSTFLHTLTA